MARPQRAQRFQLYLSSDEVAVLELASECLDKSKADVLRTALREYAAAMKVAPLTRPEMAGN